MHFLHGCLYIYPIESSVLLAIILHSFSDMFLSLIDSKLILASYRLIFGDELVSILFFICSQGILAGSAGSDSDDHVFTIVDDMNNNGLFHESSEGLLAADEEGERSVASVEEQLRKEMTVYEVCSVSL